jgi:hypothetical protein
METAALARSTTSTFVPESHNSFSLPTNWWPGWVTYWRLSQIAPSQLAEFFSAYQQIFREKPFYEEWSFKQFMQKLVRELTVPAIEECVDDTTFISLISGDDIAPVAGFCYGGIVDTELIPGRVLAAHPFEEGRNTNVINELKEALGRIPDQRVVFTDEVGILRSFRGDFTRIAQLCYPVTVVGSSQELGGVCWSKEGSKIIPILEYHHYTKIGNVGDIVMLYSPPEGVQQTKGQLEEVFARTLR